MYSMPPAHRISSRQTLPSDDLLAEGGVIVENMYPFLVDLSWLTKEGRVFKKYYLQPGSQVYMKRPNHEQPSEVSVEIYVKRAGSKAVITTLESGKKHRLLFPPKNTLWEGVPDVVPIDTAKIRGCLIVRVPRGTDEDAWRLSSDGFRSRCIYGTHVLITA